MAIVGKGTQTFLYLNGIRPRETVRLDDGVIWGPAECDPSLIEILSKCKSEVDFGVACIYLRSVRSYLRISASTSKQLLTRAWNSQWDAVLLGALFDSEVGWNFQADVPPEKFSDVTDFNIPHYHLHGSWELKTLSIANHNWIAKYYQQASTLMSNDRYLNAVSCLSNYRWHSMPRVQMAILWSGIEGLFGISHELSFRISLYISRTLYSKRCHGQKKLFDEVKRLYGIRSKAVHGNKIRKMGDAVGSSASILRRLIVKCAEQKQLPDLDNLAP